MTWFGHVDVRVADLGAALPFYDALLPALGFSERFHGDTWNVWALPVAPPNATYFAITESREHVANENRIAFNVDTREDVDRIAALVGGAAREMPYGPGYYAVFFADPSGNALEVYVRPA